MEDKKSIKEKLKDFWFRLKIFFWYLGTEPIRQLKQIYIIIINIVDALNKTRTWTYIALIFFIASFFLGKKFIAGMFLGFLLIVILLWEWEDGFFMHQHRKHIRQKIKKEAEKNESIRREERRIP